MGRKHKEEHPARSWCVRSFPRRPSWRLQPDSSFICLFFCSCVYTCKCMCPDVWGMPEGTSALSARESLPSGLTLQTIDEKWAATKRSLCPWQCASVGVSALMSAQVPWQGKGVILLLDLFTHIMKPLCNMFPWATWARSTHTAKSFWSCAGSCLSTISSFLLAWTNRDSTPRYSLSLSTGVSFVALFWITLQSQQQGASTG